VKIKVEKLVVVERSAVELAGKLLGLEYRVSSTSFEE